MTLYVPTMIKPPFAWVPEIGYTGRSIDEMNTAFFNMRMLIDGAVDAAGKSVRAHQRVLAIIQKNKSPTRLAADKLYKLGLSLEQTLTRVRHIERTQKGN